MNNEQATSKDPKEFYEMGGKNEPEMCNHHFERLNPSRVLCRRCGLGFFDNPLSPFPVDEINSQIRKEVREQNKFKKENNTVEN